MLRSRGRARRGATSSSTRTLRRRGRSSAERDSRGRQDRHPVRFARGAGDDLAIVEDDTRSRMRAARLPNYRGDMRSGLPGLDGRRRALALIAVPGDDDDKYSRGVLGVITGQHAVSGCGGSRGRSGAAHGCRDGALSRPRSPERTGARAPTGGRDLRRPRAGVADRLGDRLVRRQRVRGSDGPRPSRRTFRVVLDGGAFELHSRANGPVVITPHFRELARVTGDDRDTIAKDPGTAPSRAADSLGVTVLLKGHITYVAAPDGTRLSARAPRAGSRRRVRATRSAECSARSSRRTPTKSRGIAGMLARLAATASVLHGLAAQRASRTADRSRCWIWRRRCLRRSRPCSRPGASPAESSSQETFLPRLRLSP